MFFIDRIFEGSDHHRHPLEGLPRPEGLSDCHEPHQEAAERCASKVPREAVDAVSDRAPETDAHLCLAV